MSDDENAHLHSSENYRLVNLPFILEISVQEFGVTVPLSGKKYLYTYLYNYMYNHRFIYEFYKHKHKALFYL